MIPHFKGFGEMNNPVLAVFQNNFSIFFESFWKCVCVRPCVSKMSSHHFNFCAVLMPRSVLTTPRPFQFWIKIVF